MFYLQEDMINNTKGRGVRATAPFNKGDFIVEYRGLLIAFPTLGDKNLHYEADVAGNFVFYFTHKKKHYW